ncbi:hypothetical protein Tco_1546452 [Tanacetum coccineum]
MSSYTHQSIPSDHDVVDAFSSTNVFNHTPISPDYFRYFFPSEKISSPKDTETPVESSIPVSPSSSVGSSSPVRSTTPPPDYPFDESIFVELDNSLWIIPRPLKSEPVPEEPDDMMTHIFIQDYYDSLTIRFSQTFVPRNTTPLIESLISLSPCLSLEALNSKIPMPPKRTSTSEIPTMTQAAIRQLIVDGITAALEAQAATMENTNKNAIIFSRSKCAEEDRVTFATGTLTDDALSWWNAYAQPIEIPGTSSLCPNMVPNTEKLMEVFIGGLPRSIEGNGTASRPQTLEEATNIAHRLMDRIIKRDSVQETNDHKRKFKLNLEIFRDVFKICPRVHGQDFDALPTDEEIMSFLRDLGHTGEINSLNDVVYQMHQPWRTFVALINRSLSGKTTISPEEPTGKSKRVKRPAKKSTNAPTGVALTEDAQFEEVRRKSIGDFYKTHPSGSGTVTKTALSAANIKPSITNEGTGVKPGVPDVTEDESSENDENESDSDHDTDENESGSESDQEENKEDIGDDEEEVKDDQLYGDVDIRLNEPLDTDKGFIQEEDILHTDAEMVSPMDVHVHHEVPSQQTPTLLKVLVIVIIDSSPLKKILIDKIDKSESYLAAPEHRECYEGVIKSYDLDKTLFSTYDKVYSLKRSRKDKDKVEDPFIGSDRGLKKRKTSKDAEPTKGPEAKES